MTKKELEDLVEDLHEQIERLENYVDYWQKEYNDLEEKYDTLKDDYEDLTYVSDIRDLDDFIFKLKLENLYGKELEEFINSYVKWCN